MDALLNLESLGPDWCGTLSGRGGALRGRLGHKVGRSWVKLSKSTKQISGIQALGVC